jgi:hypothetical protein
VKYVYANVMGAEDSESRCLVLCVRSVEDAGGCRSGSDILNMLFTLHMHFVGFTHFNFGNAWSKLPKCGYFKLYRLVFFLRSHFPAHFRYGVCVPRLAENLPA